MSGSRFMASDEQRLQRNCVDDIGEHAAPAYFVVIDDIPETITGKYMRRLVRKLVEGAELGDVSSLKNPQSLASIKEKIKQVDITPAGTTPYSSTTGNKSPVQAAHNVRREVDARKDTPQLNVD